MNDPAARANRPPLALHVPEPSYRPGDAPDFSSVSVPAAGSAPRPDVAAPASETHPLTTHLVRVLDDDGRAVGPWDPRLSPDTLRQMLKDMKTVRVFDDRMYRAQRQGKTSFYMKCTGEEAIAVAAAHALDRDDMNFPTYRQQGLLIARGYPLETMMCQVYQAPVVLAVVNNQWAISSFSGLAGAEQATFAARAVGYGIAGLRVDGNDALAVHAAVRWAADRARSNHGPTLIEFFTYRAEGHSTSDDPTGYRPAGEAGAWPLGDPIARLKQHLVQLGEWDDDRDTALDKEIDATVRAAQKRAETDGVLPQQGFERIGSMFEDVFAETPWHLAEQRDEALAEAREFLGYEPK